MKGLIFNIKRYAIHDGPGIRVTFFMKGCPLDCWWCHNPEGKSPLKRQVEKVDRIGERVFRSSALVGREYTPREIVEMAERDRIFMDQSGGGVTFSGGEPLMQEEFLHKALALLTGTGINTAVDTSGYVKPESLRHIINVTSLFLYDIKHIDAEEHIKYTGVTNELIISNLDMLLDHGAEVILRIPVIPGVTTGEGYIEKLRGFIERRKSENLREINLLPYHKTGSSKYTRFGLPDRMEGVGALSNGYLDEYVEILRLTGIPVKRA
jgi:pyruvate formate lyase activating enzyme